MTNPNDTSTGSAPRAVTPSDAVSGKASLPQGASFPTAAQVQPQNAPAAKPDAGIKSSADAAREGVDQASQASDDFVKRLVDGAHAAIDKLADSAGPTVGRLASVFANPSDKLAKMAGQTGDKKNEWVGDVRDIVRENPLAAIATALAIGAIYVKLASAARVSYRDLDE